MDKELLKMNILAINDCEDHKFKRKIGYLQRYVKSLGKNLEKENKENGNFENAGQDEIRLAFKRFDQYQLDRSYQITAYLQNRIRQYFQNIGNGNTADLEWEILDFE